MLIQGNSMALVTDVNLWNGSFDSSTNKKWSDDRLWRSAFISWPSLLWRHVACALYIHCL